MSYNQTNFCSEKYDYSPEKKNKEQPVSHLTTKSSEQTGRYQRKYCSTRFKQIQTTNKQNQVHSEVNITHLQRCQTSTTFPSPSFTGLKFWFMATVLNQSPLVHFRILQETIAQNF